MSVPTAPTDPRNVETITDAELNAIKAEAERDRAQTEREKLALEKTFAKKWAAPILGLAGIIVAGFFSVAGVVVASIFKNAEEQALSKQREASATAEAKNREDRLKLDCATFLMANWQTFSKGSPEDRQAIIAITSELFPTYVSRNVVVKLAEMIPGEPNKSLQAAINLLKPRYDLSGQWRCTERCQSSNPASIKQVAERLILVNEVGDVSSGVYKTPTQFSAIEWGDLGGIVENDGRTIHWLNGSVWTR